MRSYRYGDHSSTATEESSFSCPSCSQPGFLQPVARHDVAKMQYLLGLTIALPVAAGTSRVSESDQVDLDSGVDQKWTIVEKNCWR